MADTFPKSSRLLKRPEFLRVNNGTKVVTALLVVRMKEGASGQARFGLVVSKKVGNAVVRNRVKRWLRESLRRQQHGLPSRDFVFIARPAAATAGLDAIWRDVALAFTRLGRIT